MQFDVVELYKVGGAVVGIILFFITLYKIYEKPVSEIKELRKQVEDNHIEIETLKNEHEADVEKLKQKLSSEIKIINKENLVIIKALKGCLEGLIQLNCDGDVTEAKDAIEEHLNTMAHMRNDGY